MYTTQQSMRWFGPSDAIRLDDLKAAGVSGVVTALHEIPGGEVWSIEAIQERQEYIASFGLRWNVVESLPVSEAIKQRRGDFERHIVNYKTSLENLAQCGIYTVTYNFMPVLDWVRTHHRFENSDGTLALAYDHIAFVFFDVHLLQRPGAKLSYTEDELQAARAYGERLSDEDQNELFKNALLGLPGSKGHFTAKQILELLADYAHIDEHQLRKNLICFLEEIIPVAKSCNVQMAIHPDDPPFSVLGLPRVVRNYDDLKQIFEAVPDQANGLCYCTGSLGADPETDLIQVLETFKERIHFLHLRNIKRYDAKLFQESAHLDGDHPMAVIMQGVLSIMQQRKISLPLRPDHGFLFRSEWNSESYPGYSYIGRLKALAELRGLELGLRYSKSDQLS